MATTTTSFGHCRGGHRALRPGHHCDAHHGAAEHQRLTDGHHRAGSRIHQQDVAATPDLWFLDVIFHHLRPLLGSQLIIGGDFNASRKLDETLGERGNNEFFDRINDEGFVSLHRLFHSADQRTFFARGRAEHQLDYLYADAPVVRFARSCTVQPESEFSDHSAIVVDFGDEPVDR
jgi:endonuclease/exonuclease/phosphatase (EEP) superfamily protein YafD